VIDGDSIAEFLDVADENGSEVGLIQFFLAVGKVLGAETGIRIRDGHAATASAGCALPAVGRTELGLTVIVSVCEFMGVPFGSERGGSNVGIVGAHPGSVRKSGKQRRCRIRNLEEDTEKRRLGRLNV
jgi:hypothetical protein